MGRRLIRGVGIAVLALAGVFALCLAGASLWLHSASGQRWAFARLQGELRGHGVELEAARVGGDLLHEMRLRDVRARERDHGVKMAAGEVRVRYRLLELLRRSRSPHLAVEIKDGRVGDVGFEGRLAGPPHAIHVDGEATTRGGRVHIDGAVDAVARHAELELRAPRLRLESDTSDATVVASGRAHVSARREGSGLRVVARGNGRYVRRVIDPALVGVGMEEHAQVRGEGAWRGRLEGRGGDDGLTGRFRVEHAGGVLRGSVDLPREGPAEVRAESD